MSVLILGPKMDIHVQAVQTCLTRLGVETYRFSLSQLLKRCNFRLELGSAAPVGEIKGVSAADGAASDLDFSKLSSTWLRRAGRVKAVDIPEPWAAQLAERESNRAMDGLFRILPGLWVNHPTAQSEASFKVRQLQVAKDCGFDIPRTLITNDPEEVIDFHQSCDRQMIYKLIDESTWECFPEFEIPKGMPTLPFRDSDLEHVQQVRYGLHLFQERIDKAADIRVTVVGQKIFAVKIESQLGKGDVDFRLDYSVPMALHQLPDEISDKCLKVLKALGLNFGAIDLCLTRDGRYVFLEVNAAGQWLWMEMKLDMPVSEELARLLAGLSPPLVPAASNEIATA